MAGKVGDERHPGPFPCLRIHTLPSEQGKVTEDFEGEQHSQGRRKGWERTDWAGCCGSVWVMDDVGLNLGSGDQEKGQRVI